MSNLVATLQPAPVVTVKVSGAGLQQTSTPITVHNISAPARLDRLEDVDATSEVDGGVLVYNAATDKYVVQTFQLSANTVLDGGSF